MPACGAPGPLRYLPAPGLACLVIADVAGGENVAGDRQPQRFQVAAGDGVRGSHCYLSFVHSSPGTAKR
jgi:hypothetical protein